MPNTEPTPLPESAGELQLIDIPLHQPDGTIIPFSTAAIMVGPLEVRRMLRYSRHWTGMTHLTSLTNIVSSLSTWAVSYKGYLVYKDLKSAEEGIAVAQKISDLDWPSLDDYPFYIYDLDDAGNRQWVVNPDPSFKMVMALLRARIVEALRTKH